MNEQEDWDWVRGFHVTNKNQALYKKDTKFVIANQALSIACIMTWSLHHSRASDFQITCQVFDTSTPDQDGSILFQESSKYDCSSRETRLWLLFFFKQPRYDIQFIFATQLRFWDSLYSVGNQVMAIDSIGSQGMINLFMGRPNHGSHYS